MAKDKLPVHPLFGGLLEGNNSSDAPATDKNKSKGAGKPAGKAAKSAKAAKAGKAGKAAKFGKASGAGKKRSGSGSRGEGSKNYSSAASGKKRPASRSGKRAKKRAATHTGPPAGTIRIQKLMAEAGIDSRRACEQIVSEGRVSVNGKAIHSLPCFVNPDSDVVTIDGQKIKLQQEKKVYILLNKPRGVVCTSSDAEDRPRAVDLVAHVAQRVFPVGRLDADSTGVIIMTNDGEFANLISHPRYGVTKTYVVEITGRVDGESIEKLKAGIHLDGHRAKATGVKVLQRSNARTLLEIRLNEGRNREIRRMLARMDYKVKALRRVAIGPIGDRGIKTGNCRLLRPQEIDSLRKAALGPEK